MNDTGGQGMGSQIVSVNNYSGIYYYNNQYKLELLNLKTDNYTDIIKIPNLYYNYLDYNGVYYTLMPYYNSQNVLTRISSYGDYGSSMWFWSYDILSGTVINQSLNFNVSESTNFQINYLGNGEISIINSSGLLDIYDLQEKKVITHVTLSDFEANNIYYVPAMKSFINVNAAASTSDTIVFYSFINNVLKLNQTITYSVANVRVNGVPNIVVDSRTNQVYIQTQGGGSSTTPSGYNIILQYDRGKFLLFSATPYTIKSGINFNPANGYIPIYTYDGYIAVHGEGYGQPPAIFFNPFTLTAINSTSGFPYDSFDSSSYGLGESNLIPDFYNSVANSTHYSYYLNYKTSVLTYSYSSSQPEFYNYVTPTPITPLYHLIIGAEAYVNGTKTYVDVSLLNENTSSIFKGLIYSQTLNVSKFTETIKILNYSNYYYLGNSLIISNSNFTKGSNGEYYDSINITYHDSFHTKHILYDSHSLLIYIIIVLMLASVSTIVWWHRKNIK
jgi:hypothetical protein